MASPVVLIGDSTIDNIVWVSSPDECVTEILKTRLGAAHNVVNYAADGFTTTDVLTGGSPRISRSARAAAGDPLPIGPVPDVFAPLDHVCDVPAVSTGIVVLSCGGNDIREILRDMSSIAAVMARLKANYIEICQRLVSLTSKVVLQLQYRPSLAVEVRAP